MQGARYELENVLPALESSIGKIRLFVLLKKLVHVPASIGQLTSSISGTFISNLQSARCRNNMPILRYALAHRDKIVEKVNNGL